MNFVGGFPRKIVFGKGMIEKIPEILSEVGLSGKPMLVTGKRFARSSGYLDKLQSLLESAGTREILIFDKVEPNPSAETVNKGGRIARNSGVSFIIGFGGGSAMDAAKGIAIIAAQGGNIRDYYYPADIAPPVLPIVAIPTTCGTGSEVTKYAVFSDNFRKNIVVSDHIVPMLAILDPNVLKYLPRKLLAYTAMDALSHALESYFHTKASKISEIFSIEALRVILANFKRAYEGDMSCREKLLYASMLAGFAINLSGSVIAHGLGYYLTEKFEIPHGLANALFINPFIEYLAEKLPKRVFDLVKATGFDASEPLEASKMLIAKINELKLCAGLPMSLSEASIPESELQRIVEEGLSYKRNIENCQAAATVDDIKKIVERSFRGAQPDDL